MLALAGRYLRSYLTVLKGWGRQWPLLYDLLTIPLLLSSVLLACSYFLKSMTGKEIARELINTLSAQYNIGSDLLIAAMHDRAACNMFALRTLTVMFPKLADVGCFSHMLDLVGEKFTTPHLSSVMVWWISLFSHSPKSMLLWKDLD